MHDMKGNYKVKKYDIFEYFGIKPVSLSAKSNRSKY